MEKFVEDLILADINRCVKVYGIEGCEDCIYRAYAGCQHLRDKYLKVFYKKFNFLTRNDFL